MTRLLCSIITLNRQIEHLFECRRGDTNPKYMEPLDDEARRRMSQTVENAARMSSRHRQRRELLDRTIIWNQQQLERLVTDYIDHSFDGGSCEDDVASGGHLVEFSDGDDLGGLVDQFFSFDFEEVD